MKPVNLAARKVDNNSPTVSMTSSANAGLDLSLHQLINAEQLMTLIPVSRMTLWRLEKQGRLPKHIRIGGRNYWRLSGILEALEKFSIPALTKQDNY